jgi:hypothetical protein
MMATGANGTEKVDSFYMRLRCRGGIQRRYTEAVYRCDLQRHQHSK